MKKTLVKRNYSKECVVNTVMAFDEGISDQGISGFTF